MLGKHSALNYISTQGECFYGEISQTHIPLRALFFTWRNIPETCILLRALFSTWLIKADVNRGHLAEAVLDESLYCDVNSSTPTASVQCSLERNHHAET